ncbi:MAG: hypothetical protein KJ645_04450, partial [Planctomycetes bacterium]|nr:hypothetical protein [Planctomycetota bacterium]
CALPISNQGGGLTPDVSIALSKSQEQTVQERLNAFAYTFMPDQKTEMLRSAPSSDPQLQAAIRFLSDEGGSDPKPGPREEPRDDR